MKIILCITDSNFFLNNVINDNNFSSDELIKFKFSQFTIDDLIYEFSTPSIFSDKKYILIDECDEVFKKNYDNERLFDYLNKPNSDTNIIFHAHKVDNNSKFYQFFLDNLTVIEDKVYYNRNVQPSDVKKYVFSHGSKISDKSIQYILDACLYNKDIVFSEIDKLLVLGNKEISDDLVYGLVVLTPDGNTSLFIDSLLDNNNEKALECAKNFEILNIDVSNLLALIAWNIRIMLLFKNSRAKSDAMGKIVKLYKLSSYSQSKLTRLSNLRSVDELQDLLVFLANLDFDIKNHYLDKSTLGYILINKFCN